MTLHKILLTRLTMVALCFSVWATHACSAHGSEALRHLPQSMTDSTNRSEAEIVLSRKIYEAMRGQNVQDETIFHFPLLNGPGADQWLVSADKEAAKESFTSSLPVSSAFVPVKFESPYGSEFLSHDKSGGPPIKFPTSAPYIENPEYDSNRLLPVPVYVDGELVDDGSEDVVVVDEKLLAEVEEGGAIIILPWYSDYYKYWSGSFELGLDGVEGNTKTFNFRAGLELKRKTKITLFQFELDYRKTRSDNKDTGNMCFLDARLERLLGKGIWSAFIRNTTSYDEFKNYNVRVATDLGLSLLLIKRDNLTFKTRTGAGFSQEYGGVGSEASPEITLGWDLDWKLNDRNKLSATMDYMPNVTDFNDFRMQFESSWETIINVDMNLSMKLGVLDRYDSTPNGNLPNDLDYTLLIVWSF